MFSYQMRPPEQEYANEKAPHRSILLQFEKNLQVPMATRSNFHQLGRLFHHLPALP